MNPARLLTQFERLADAPDAIPRLRRFVLNLAVRGRLIPQDSNDEPASELLKRVGKLPPPPRYSKRSVELIPGDCGLSINEPDLPVPCGWIALLEEQEVGADRRVGPKDAVRQTDDGVEVALFHQVLLEPGLYTFAEEGAVGQDHGGPAAGLQEPDDEREE
jgi:hypothetical protein